MLFERRYGSEVTLFRRYVYVLVDFGFVTVVQKL